MSGHVSSTSGAQLPGVCQQNGNVVPDIVAAGSDAPRAVLSADPDLLRDRNYMQEKIFFLLAQRHQQPINDSQMQKLKDIVKRLEEGLFKSARTKEEYVNLGTLESRLHSLIKRPSLNSQVDVLISKMAGSSIVQPTNADTGSHMSSGVMQSSSFNRTDGSS